MNFPASTSGPALSHLPRIGPSRRVGAFRSRVLGAVLVVGGLAPLGAQTGEIGELPPALGPGRQLVLFEAIRLALENNLDLQIADLDPLNAADAVAGAWGAFDPRVFAQSFWEDNAKPQNSLDLASIQSFLTNNVFEERNLRARSGVGGRLPIGTTYELSLDLNRLENSVNRNNPTALFSPEFESFAGVTITQPLLRNFGYDANLAGVRAARVDLAVAEYERHIAVVNKTVEVINAYFDLVFGQENLVVKQAAISSAEQLLTESRERLRLGLITAVQVSEAELKGAEAREELLLAEDFVRKRRINLMRLILRDFRAGQLPEFTVEGVPSPTLPAMDINLLIETALERRPDYQLTLQEQNRERVRVAYTRDQRLPELNLRFTYGLAGISQSPEGALNDIVQADEVQWSAGFAFSYPLLNREARAQRHIAARSLRQAELRTAKSELNIALDVHEAYSHLLALRQRLETAQKSRELSEAALEVERARLANGQSTVRTVLEFQDKSSDARTRELAALVDLQKGIAELWAVSGVLLERQGFLVEDRVKKKS